MGVGADHSTESLGMARGPGSSMMVTLFRGAVLLGILLLAISGAASPWGGEEESQLGSHQSSSLANNGVHSLMRRGADGEVKTRRSENKSDSKAEKKKKKKMKEGKEEKGIK